MYILYRCMQLWGSLNSVEPLSKSFKSFVFRTFGYRFYTIYWTPQLHTHIQQIHIHIFIFRTPIDRTPVEGALSFLLFFLKRQPKLYFRLLCIRKYNTIWINYQTPITYVIIIINMYIACATIILSNHIESVNYSFVWSRWLVDFVCVHALHVFLGVQTVNLVKSLSVRSVGRCKLFIVQ